MGGSPQLSGELHAVAVVVADARAELADLVLLGLLDGSWIEFERTFLLGLALEHAQPNLVTRSDVRTAATPFRLERGLISAKDFTAWMAARRLTVEDVYRYLRRGLLRERAPAPEPPAGGPAAAVTPDERAAELRSEAICSGYLHRLADVMIAWLVAARRLPSEPVEDDERRAAAALELADGRTLAGLELLGTDDLRRRLRRLVLAQRSATLMREEIAGSGLVARRISQHGLEWIRLTGAAFGTPAEDAAREVRLLLSEGVGETVLAERSGLAAATRSMLCEEFPADLVAAHASAVPGEAIGPWPDGSGWSAMRVVEKRLPSESDPELCRRAVDELMREAVVRDGAGRTQRRYAD